MAAPHMNAGLPFRSNSSVPPSRFTASTSLFGYIVDPNEVVDNHHSPRTTLRSPATTSPTSHSSSSWLAWDQSIRERDSSPGSRHHNLTMPPSAASFQYSLQQPESQVSELPNSLPQKTITSPIPASTSDVTRKPIEGDCSICWDSLQGQEKDLVFCQKTCGQNFHKSCFVDWLKTPKHQHAEPELKCPYCRGAWDPSELRKLQFENGVSPPPRPHKRPRPDHSIRAAQRDFHRRIYRERQQSLRRDGHQLPRLGTTGYPARPMIQASYAASFDVASSPPGSRPQSSTLQQLPPSQPMRSMPSAGQSSPFSPQLLQNSPMMYGSFVPPFPMQSQMINSMNQPIPSHDLTAPGYSMAPSFTPNAFSSPMLPQRQPFQSPDFYNQPVSRCPHIRAQMQTMQPNMSIAGPQGSYQSIPRNCPQPSFEVQINQYVQHQTMHTYNFYPGPSFP